ncbi:hypothetical protein [Flavitalea sp.]|nr:hypothetical protein [Flavitalea sp.]
MSDHFVVFQKFTHQAQAEEIVELFRSAGIDYQLEGTKAPFDPTFTFTSYEPEVELKIKQKDFQRAGNLLDSHYQQMISDVPSDYYLNNFSDVELQDLIQKKDEWGQFDYVFAKHLLGERGSAITSEAENEITSQRLLELKKPAELSTYWIVIGYVLAVIGSLIGFFMALTILVFRKTLPDGELIFGYDKYSRNHAMAMMIISGTLLLLRFLFNLPLFYEILIPFF